MFLFYKYKKNGLPYGLITIHEFLIRDLISYFEKGKLVKKNIKEARKTIKAALKFAKKKKIYPSSKTAHSLKVLGELLEEMDTTHMVLKAAAEEMETAIKSIKEEKVGQVIPLVERAREEFRADEMKKGMELLAQAQDILKTKDLLETRKKLLGGFDSEIKTIKKKIQQKL